MNPNLLLGIVTALAGFALKTTFAFGLCLVFSRLVDSPNRRFLIWLAFLYGSAAYWLWLANGILPVERLPASAPLVFAQPATSTIGAWQIPSSWAIPLSVALRVAGIGYLLVLSYILVTYLKKQRRLKWVLDFTCKPPVEIAETFQPLAESLRAGRTRLLVLSGVTSPATFGWIRPTILLPALCLEQDRSDLEDILRHELHHVRRWDFVWNGFAIAFRGLLFFHPAAWYAVRQMQFDRELACDLAVISHAPARRATYAESLVRFARLNLSQDPKVWGIDFAASSEHLKARVHSILAGSKKPSGWLLCLRASLGLTLFAGFLGVTPSLAVLLSYAQREIPQPLEPTISATHAKSRDSGKSSRKGPAVSIFRERGCDGCERKPTRNRSGRTIHGGASTRQSWGCPFHDERANPTTPPPQSAPW